jgi:hypothetical protein
MGPARVRMIVEREPTDRPLVSSFTQADGESLAVLVERITGVLDAQLGVPALERPATLRAERDGLAKALEAQCWEHANNCCAKWCPRCQAGDEALLAIGRKAAF